MALTLIADEIGLVLRQFPSIFSAILVVLFTSCDTCEAQSVGSPIFNEEIIRGHVANAPADPGCLFDQPVRFSDPRSVLQYILLTAPHRAIVYPSERYYYYRFQLGGRSVSGNIRFVDAEIGGISIGYFDEFNPIDMVVGEFHNGQDCIEVAFNAASNEVIIILDGLSRTFVLDQEAFEPPTFPLLEGERLISGVRDESGYFFYLIYWKPNRSFYYVVNPLKPLPENWIRGESELLQISFGARSRFCFLHHPKTGRDILVGVHRRNVQENNWFDGPFDQVPPHLPIRSVLEEAYPYIIDAGGIDEHGNFLKMQGQRVAISPYRAYDSGPMLELDLEHLVRDVATPAAWTAATYEYKKNWHPPKGEPGISRHVTPISKSWPANHWAGNSSMWGSDHHGGTSAQWPPNHVSQVSSTEGVAPEHEPPSD